MANKESRTLLVTGAAGHLGRRVVEALLESGVERIIATTRRPDALKDLAARGVVVRKASFDDPRGLERAFVGAERMLLVSVDQIEGRAAKHRAAITAASNAGVGHVVYTSLTRPEVDSPVLLAADHHATEAALGESRMTWTTLRNNLYDEGLLGALPRAVATGKLVAATGDGGAGYVAREDCARAAAAALASSAHDGEKLDVTGPALVTHKELARILTELSGRKVSYVPTDPAAMRARMVSGGMPGNVADLYVSFDVGIARGTFAVTSSAVQDLTGHVPMSLTDFLTAHREAFAVGTPA